MIVSICILVFGLGIAILCYLAYRHPEPKIEEQHNHCHDCKYFKDDKHTVKSVNCIICSHNYKCQWRHK